MKPALLFLCHRIPYPPNKGDKIRAYNLLHYLKDKYRVFLGTFVDDKADWEHIGKLRSWCADTCFVELKPYQAKIRSLSGLFIGRPLTLPYYYDSLLDMWVKDIVAHHKIERLFVFSSSMAQYVMTPVFNNTRRVIDLVDVDSDKWRQFADTKPWPFNWIYRREAKRLLSYESEIASCFDVSIFVSKAEVDLFRQIAPDSAHKISFIGNGVDAGYFTPEITFKRPFSSGEEALVFVGTMDYWPNVDAVVWFGRKVFPQILADIPEVRFYIVGRNPVKLVRDMEQIAGIKVTGAVDDVRPYLQHAAIVLAPMRIARGVQNKVLEAMAMAKPVLVSSPGLTGIEAKSGDDLMVANGKDEFYQKAEAMLSNNKEKTLGHNARKRVCSDYAWKDQLPKIVNLIEG